MSEQEQSSSPLSRIVFVSKIAEYSVRNFHSAAKLHAINNVFAETLEFYAARSWRFLANLIHTEVRQKLSALAQLHREREAVSALFESLSAETTPAEERAGAARRIASKLRFTRVTEVEALDSITKAVASNRTPLCQFLISEVLERFNEHGRGALLWVLRALIKQGGLSPDFAVPGAVARNNSINNISNGNGELRFGKFTNNIGEFPLVVIAALAGNTPAVRMLVDELQCDIHQVVELPRSNSMNALHAAALSNCAATLTVLLDNGRDADAEFVNGGGRPQNVSSVDSVTAEEDKVKLTTPLHVAVAARCAVAVRLLTKARAIDINARDAQGFTPFRTALRDRGSRSGALAVIELLLHAGASVETSGMLFTSLSPRLSGNKLSALAAVAVTDDVELAAMILKHRPDELEKPIVPLSSSGDAENSDKAHDGGCQQQQEQQDHYCATPLALAIEAGTCFAMVELLLKHGANPKRLMSTRGLSFDYRDRLSSELQPMLGVALEVSRAPGGGGPFRELLKTQAGVPDEFLTARRPAVVADEGKEPGQAAAVMDQRSAWAFVRRSDAGENDDQADGAMSMK